MLRLTTLAAVGLFAASTAVYAAPELKRVRGTVESATDTTVTVKTNEGGTQEIQVAPDTAYVDVVNSSLDNVKDGKFIGTATKGENPPKAIEVVIFPPEMNGTAEGHYAWDSINDPTGGGPSKSAMTNGTIKSSGGAPKSKSAMTNATVKSGGGSKLIEVTYDGGKSLKIEIPPKAPIVEFVKRDKSIVQKGGKIFAVTAVDGGKLQGKLVAIGKDGVTPPM